MTSSSVRYCFPAKWGFFLYWGIENSQMVPNQENMEGDQPVQSQYNAQQPFQPQISVQEPLSVFQAVHEMSLVLHVLFKVLNYLSSAGFYLEGNNAVSIRKG